MSDDKTLRILPKVGDTREAVQQEESVPEAERESGFAVSLARVVPIIKTVKVLDDEAEFDRLVNEAAKDGWDLRSVTYIPNDEYLWFIANLMKVES